MGKKGNGRGGFVPSFLILIVLGLGGFAGEIFAQAPQVDSFNPGYARQVWSIALQPDGKVLVGGWFNIGGQTSLARLNRDGTLDSSFNPVVAGQGIPETTVYSIAVQPDGKIVIGGGFASVNGQSRTNIARLNSDGTLDMSFYPAAAGVTGDYVFSALLQDDGKIVLAGHFRTLNGQPRASLGRLNADGTLDGGFNPAGDYGYKPAIQADGKIVVGGSVRLNPDGTDDSSFNPPSPNGFVEALVVQADGKIVLGGGFTRLDIEIRNHAARLNADGTLDDGFDPDIDGPLFALALQTDGKIVVGGGFYHVAGQSRTMIARLNADGTLDNSFNPAATDPSVRALVVQPDGKILVGGNFATLAGQPRAGIGRLNSRLLVAISQSVTVEQDSSVEIMLQASDPDGNPLSYSYSQPSHGTVTGVAPNVTYQPATYYNGPDSFTFSASDGQGGFVSATVSITVTPTPGHSPEVDGFDPGGSVRAVWSMVLEPGGLLVGGWFNIGGQSNLALINQAGFNPVVAGRGIPETTVYSIAVQPWGRTAVEDRRIVIAGSFTSVNGQSRTNIARLNANGTLDTSFYPAAAGVEGDYVLSAVPQADGKIVLAGHFGTLNGEPRKGLGRLNADGTLDSAFNPAGDYGGQVAVIQTDGKIVVGASVRLNPDGTRDSSFNPPAPNGYVDALVVQADGKIVLGGSFTRVGAEIRNHAARLNADGTLDYGFDPNVDGPVFALALQTDGTIVVGGGFYHVAGQPRTMIARLNADGTLDNSFNPAATDSAVRVLAVQPDGKIVVGGEFGTLGGQPRAGIGRLNSTGAPTESLALSNDGSSITWLRGGTSPEVWRTTFEFNLNGEDWDSAGAGSRVAGGWQVSGLSRLSIPAYAQLRARGFVSGGALGGSTWFVQTLGYRTTLALRVALQSGGDTVDVSWPITSNVDLFSTSSLTPPINWQPVTSPRGRTVGTFHAYVPCTNGAVFFQLRPSP